MLERNVRKEEKELRWGRELVISVIIVACEEIRTIKN